MPDETKFKAVRAWTRSDVWYAWYRDGGFGVFIREADGHSLVSYTSESEAKDSAWLAYGLTAPSGVQLELLL